MKSELLEKWEVFKSQHPKVRIREAALQLAVSEADLLSTGIGKNVTLLKPDFKELLKDVESIGKVMALTRNNHCVHERKGIYKKVSFNGNMGLAVNPDIDLRLFMSVWSFGFSVFENERYSFQFFDEHGIAVHKIYMTDDSDKSVFLALTEKYKDPVQLAPFIGAVSERVVAPDVVNIDEQGFKEAWRNLEDTHDFFGLLKKFNVPRRHAMDIAPEGMALKLTIEDLKKVLFNAAEKAAEIMVFTGSKGCIQIHTGFIKNLIQTGPWFNVLDPEFNMHLREDGIESVWLVRKPTKDGDVHAIEVYDSEGEIIVQFFGKRKPGIPESEAWRNILEF